MILKTYIFSYASGNYQQYISDHSETFIRQNCINSTEQHQIVVRRDGNLMYYTYVYKKNTSTALGLSVVCGEICMNLHWLYEFLLNTLDVSAQKGVLFAYDEKGAISQKVTNFSAEAAEVDNIFRTIKDYLEKRPSYWGTLPPEDFSIPMTSKMTLAFSDDDNNKIIEALRHYHNVVVTMENTAPSSFSKTVARLNSEKEELTAQRNNLENEIESLKRQKKQYRWVISLSLLVAAALVAIVLFNQNVNNLNYTLNKKEATIDSLHTVISNKNNTISNQEEIISRKDRDLKNTKSELASVQSSMNDLSQYTPLIVSDITMKNGGEDYGETIYSRNTTYLYPRLKVYGLVDRTITLYIKFYTPNGLSTGTGKWQSPPGYSYKDDVTIQKNRQTMLYPAGWGGKDKGHWQKGTYRIEIWHNNSCLKTKTFTIY